MRTSGMMSSSNKVLIVGAGMAGLTAGAYLQRAGAKVTILEKTAHLGGLVQSYRKEGFLFDTGPRAIGNAGILEPMIQDLGLALPLLRGEVSLGVADRIIHFNNFGDTAAYMDHLRVLFPENKNDIAGISRRIIRASAGTRTLNKLPNPFFKNPLTDPAYLFRIFLPWLPSFIKILMQRMFTDPSIEKALSDLTDNESLQDIIGQHFFKGTPESFALGYFESFLDYYYPREGTGALPEALAEKIRTHGGSILTDRTVCAVDPVSRTIRDQTGESFTYDQLLWAADLKSLYALCNPSHLPSRRRRSWVKKKNLLTPVSPGESVYTLFLAVNEDPATFAAVSRGHFIYTPLTAGLGELRRSTVDQLMDKLPSLSQTELFQWVDDFCGYNSYEISIPVLKNPDLAPSGQTGLIISLLCEGKLWSKIEDSGRYEEVKKRFAEQMIHNLEQSLYPGLREKILFQDAATPMTLKKRFATAEGAITGWTMESPSPVPHRLTGISKSVRTTLPAIWTAGQWTYSPSGVPIAILTGRIAAGAIQRSLKLGQKFNQ